MTPSSFKERLHEPRAILAPGVYDALSALVAEQAGFEALYLSGASNTFHATPPGCASTCTDASE